MMVSSKKSRVGLITGIVALTLFAFASIKPVMAGPQFASVDQNKVFTSSAEKTRTDAELETQRASLLAVLNTLSTVTILPPEDITRLNKILQKKPAELTETEKKSKDDLIDKAKSDKAALSQKKLADLSSADQLRVQTLQERSQAGQDTLKEIYKDFSTQLDTQRQQRDQTIAAHMKEAIASVAQKQGISVVFDSAVAVYTSTDITKDVIAAINK
jgi:Skp family chaperone for outer membrane proteins